MKSLLKTLITIFSVTLLMQCGSSSYVNDLPVQGTVQAIDHIALAKAKPNPYAGVKLATLSIFTADNNDEPALLIIKKYDPNGRELRVSNYDSHGEYAYGPDGYAVQVKKYSSNESIVELSYYDSDGSEKAINSGLHRAVYKYDEHGYVNEIWRYDVSGSLVGYIPKISFEWNARRDVKWKYYLDSDGEKTKLRFEYIYDELGNVVSENTWHWLMKATSIKINRYESGELHSRLEFDDDDNLISNYIYTTTGMIDGESIEKKEFDQKGKLKSSIVTEYDERHLPTGTFNYDYTYKFGEPVKHSQQRISYDYEYY